jgi:hypothetical protein
MWDAEQNIRACESLASDLLAGSAVTGLLPVCFPSMMRALGGLANEEEERALATMLLRRCDALLLVHDWRVSADVHRRPQFEVDEAIGLGIPVFGLTHERQRQRDDGRAMASLIKWAKNTPPCSATQRVDVLAAADAYRAACVQHRATFDEVESTPDNQARFEEISRRASGGNRLSPATVMEYVALSGSMTHGSADILAGLDAVAIAARDALCAVALC